jgi:hypothetical protein
VPESVQRIKTGFVKLHLGMLLVINLLILSNDLLFLTDEDYNELRKKLERLTYHINKISR